MSNRHYPLDKSLQTHDAAKLLYVTESSYEGDWPSYMHSHYFSELFYVKSGAGQFLVEGESFPIAKNDLIIVNPNVSHTETSLSSQPLSYLTLGIEGLRFSFRDDKDYTIFNCAGEKSNLLFFFSSMLSELQEKKEGYQEVCISMLNVLTIQLQRITNLAFDVMVSEPVNQTCARIKRYIDSNYPEPITLESLAAMAHLNKYYFAHAFTNAYGVAPIGYLNERRLQICKDLLQHTDHSIAEIAQSVGFSSQSYFSQSFKKNCHVTAGEYRKMTRPGQQAEQGRG